MAYSVCCPWRADDGGQHPPLPSEHGYFAPLTQTVDQVSPAVKKNTTVPESPARPAESARAARGGAVRVIRTRHSLSVMLEHPSLWLSAPTGAWPLPARRQGGKVRLVLDADSRTVLGHLTIRPRGWWPWPRGSDFAA